MRIQSGRLITSFLWFKTDFQLIHSARHSDSTSLTSHRSSLHSRKRSIGAVSQIVRSHLPKQKPGTESYYFTQHHRQVRKIWCFSCAIRAIIYLAIASALSASTERKMENVWRSISAPRCAPRWHNSSNWSLHSVNKVSRHQCVWTVQVKDRSLNGIVYQRSVSGAFTERRVESAWLAISNS